MFEPPEFPFKEITNTFKEQLVEDGTNLFANEQIDGAIAASEIASTDCVTISQGSQEVHLETLQITNNMLGEHQIVITDLDLNKAKRTNEDGTETHYILLNSNEIVIGDFEDGAINEYIIKDGDNSGSIILHQCEFCTEVFTDINGLWTHTLESHAVVTETEIIESNTVQSDQENNDLNIIQQNEECVTENSTAKCTICSTCNRILAVNEPLNETYPTCCKGTTDTCQVQSLYSCEKCDTYFTIRPSALLSHQAACQGSENHDPNIESSRHLDTDSIQTNYLCNNCCHVCSSKEELSKHVSACTVPVVMTKPVTITGPSSKMWNCGSCNQLFTTARELYQHKRGEDRQPGSQLTTYICEECDKVFGSVCALHTHLKTHVKVKPGYPCKVCGRRFNQSGHLAIHMRMHTGERPYPCDLCTKAFKVKVERDDHRRTHTGERPFACTVCDKTFTAAARLREHSRIHTDQRPYRCAICGAAFRRPYARTVHTLIHTGQKPHECNICGTAFRRSGDMWKHKRTLHGIGPVLKSAANQQDKQ